MAKLNISSKFALYLFITLTVVIIAMGIWWITLIAHVMDEKVELAEQLGAEQSVIDQIHEEEISRQIMIGVEGLFFLVLIGFGVGLIYRSFVNNQKLNFQQQNFLLGVTHELKTPLASMKIYLDTLGSEKVTDEKKLMIIPRIKKDVVRMEKLIENILEAGRFEQSSYKLHKELIDFSYVVELSIEKINSYSHDKSLEIIKKIEPAIELYGDPYALGRAIDAVLENSLKYNDKEQIIISVELTTINSFIILTITDNGIGLDREELEKIFDRFYRVGLDINRSKPGSGLGLYLCREIVQAHRGQIFAESEGPGKGISFNFKLKNRNQ